MRALLLGMMLGVAIVLAGVFFYFKLGYAPVATASAPMPFEEKLAEAALNARIKKEAPSDVPIQADERNLAEGVRVYRQSCAVCHGLRGAAETPIAKGMFPKPPQFLAHPAKAGSPVGQTFWVVKNGIRLTGMPAFEGSLNDEQIWQVSLMLENRDGLPDSLGKLLSEPAETEGETATRSK